MSSPTSRIPLSDEGAAKRFEELAEPLRREIRVHCYRMLGSLNDAEDLVQETYLRAWRSFDSYQDGSFRAWLYRIATNACLNAIASKKRVRRVLPEQMSASTTEMPDGPPAVEIYWLEPIPDSQLEGIADDRQNPEAHYAGRESVRLAFVAALQQLPARQRATLLLSDVLDWSAAEIAGLLGSSVASVNSALQRARKTLSDNDRDAFAPAPLPSPAQQETLNRYLKAWEAHDVDAFAAILREDAIFAMPPYFQWYVGRETIRSFFTTAWKTCSGLRLVPTAANGQPAFAVYSWMGEPREWRAHSLHILSMDGDQISKLTAFVEPTGATFFESFGLPPVLS